MKLRLQAPLPRCRWAAATALAVAVAGSPFVVAGTAQAAGSGEVEIDVHDSVTWDAIAGQTVTLYSTATGAAVGSPRVTGPDGEVDFTGLVDGGYTAKVSASANYHEKYSTVVTVDEDHPFAWNEVALAPITPTNGRLSGTVTKPGDRIDAEIEIFPADATDASIESGDVQPVASVNYAYGYSDGDDARADWARQLAPGSYKVLVGDQDSPETVHHKTADGYDYGYGYDYDVQGWSEHESQVWVGSGAANDADHAKPFTVNAAKTTKTDTVVLAAGADSRTDGRISGTVTGTAGAALGDVQVNLFQQQDDGSWRNIGAERTGKDGKFGFTETYDYDTGDSGALPAGVYTVAFEDQRQEYAPEFLGDVAPSEESSYGVPADAQTVTLGEDDEQVADASLASVPIDRSSGVFGTVTDDLGKAHAGEVMVVDVDGNYATDLLTRRDGTWAVPATRVAPGQYKAAADDSVDVEGWYGGKSFKTARTVTVPVKGAADLGNSLLARFAKISGKITLPTVPGRDSSDAYVVVYDADGDSIDGAQLDDTGRYSFAERPGIYYVAAAGTAYDSFDESAVGVSAVRFIRQFWSGKYSLATATPIVVGSGGTASNVNITLGRTLAATTAPSIAGTAKAGSKLTAAPGTWNVSRDVAFAYTWKRNGVVVGHAATYAVTAADHGTTLTLTVTATDTNLEYATGTANATPVAVPKPAPVKHHKKKHHKKKHKKHKK